MQEYQGMECIREYVDVSYHRLISKALPDLSNLMRSEKLLNRTALSNEDNTSESSLVRLAGKHFPIYTYIFVNFSNKMPLHFTGQSKHIRQSFGRFQCGERFDAHCVR